MLQAATSSDAAQLALGGSAPDVFATGRLDDPRERGPISILPPAQPDAPFAPNACGPRGEACANTRAGDVLSSDAPARLTGPEAFSDGEDSPRATVPFRLHGRYWTHSGGSDGDRGTATEPYPARLATGNAYVTSWGCRGHFFSGAVRAQQTDARVRYGSACR
jgi:hypothetical protein